MKSEANILLVQPEDGIAPLITALDGASESIDILIFRFDLRDVENALVRAVGRGVRVRALVAHTSSNGEKSLRSLESRLLKAGVTVSRTADDLVRYHGKMMVIDAKTLFVLGFNFTAIDARRSRSFGIVTTTKAFVAEAMRVFEADMVRQPFKPEQTGFLVSPLNARKQLADFIRGAKKTLDIYDPGANDAAMARIIQERVKAGVTLRLIGSSSRNAARRLGDRRLHVRLIVRDGAEFFIGSQSLRSAELDRRREIGLIVADKKLAARIEEVFEADWQASEPSSPVPDQSVPAQKIAKHVAKTISRDLPSVGLAVNAAIKELAGEDASLSLDSEELQSAVRDAVKDAVRDAVQDAVDEVNAA